jgi:hypothetical protein
MSESTKETLASSPQQDDSGACMAETGRFSLRKLLIGLPGRIAETVKAVLLFMVPKGGIRIPTLTSRTLSALALAIAVAALIGGPFSQTGGRENARIEAIEHSLRTIETRLAIPGADSVHSPDHARQLLAIQFVTNAAERSSPFDTALAVAIRMTGDHEEIGPLLDQLLIEAPNGVPSREDLRTDFRERLVKFEQDGVVSSISDPSGVSSFGITDFLGLGGSDSSKQDVAVIQKLSAQIASDRFPEAVQLIGKLDGALRDGLESWREGAMRRTAVDATLAELRRIAFLGILGNRS